MSISRVRTSRRCIARSRLGRLLACLMVFLATAAEVPARDRLVFEVHPYKTAVELEFMFAPLTSYLSSLIGKPVLLSVSRDYEEHIRRIGEGQADIAFMAPALYVETVARYGKKPLLARFETERIPTYYGVIFVGGDSPIAVMKDLKGTRIAFSDRRSTSGHIVPRHLLHRAGIALEDFTAPTSKSPTSTPRATLSWFPIKACSVCWSATSMSAR